ncbi:hypothetical protein DU508_20585 [Pedobacter chinensis]|uniref:Uncharacterized protein n=1 Tax=Pedobacter chinensis TaxID=2282421 RepID=A0A369PPR7_9SPHI|nr:hypothetical protein ASF92_15550 [Pedobacter sp. Leaf176]RDC54621.1 hypothetical protein DU508_20585 [Pedobacter chinensis]
MNIRIEILIRKGMMCKTCEAETQPLQKFGVCRYGDFKAQICLSFGISKIICIIGRSNAPKRGRNKKLR